MNKNEVGAEMQTDAQDSMVLVVICILSWVVGSWVSIF